MRKTLWIMLAVLLVAIGAPNAHADSTDYTLTFTLTDGNPIAASGGTVVLDNTTDTYTTFLVDWNGAVFDFIGVSQLAPTGVWIACAENVPSDPNATCDQDGGSPSIFTFSPAFSCYCGAQATGTGSFTDATAIALGTYELTAVAAPEPSSVALMLLGLGLVFGLRKRNSRGHQLAT